MTHLTAEELLRAIEDKAGMLRYLTSAGKAADEPPDQTALSGIEDACRDIEQMAAAVRRSLTADALVIEIPLNRYAAWRSR